MKKDFIIIMGSDGSGKTTIARGLSESLGYEVRHCGPPKDKQDGFNQYFNFIKDNNENVIFDRFHEGEAIFAPLYRGYDGSDYFPYLEEQLKEKFNPLLVLAYAPYDIIVERLNTRGEDFVRPEHFKVAYDKATDVFNKSSLPKMIINTHDNSCDDNVLKIIKQIKN